MIHLVQGPEVAVLQEVQRPYKAFYKALPVLSGIGRRMLQQPQQPGPQPRQPGPGARPSLPAPSSTKHAPV